MLNGPAGRGKGCRPTPSADGFHVSRFSGQDEALRRTNRRGLPCGTYSLCQISYLPLFRQDWSLMRVVRRGLAALSVSPPACATRVPAVLAKIWLSCLGIGTAWRSIL